jgi:hypothetical protein
MTQKRKYKLFFILMLFGILVNAQDSATTLIPVKKYELVANDFSVDQMGNIYAILPSMQLKKLSEKGDSLAVFNFSKRWGKLSSIDVSNPLKGLLYFGNYATLVTVDRLLHITNTIDLRSKNYYQVQAIASSYDNQYWFYDEQVGAIKKVNDQGIITRQSIDLRQIYTALPTPTKIVDNDNLLYLYDQDKGLYVFDYYGAEKQTVPALKGLTDVHIFDKKAYGLQNDSLVKYDMVTRTFHYKKLAQKELPRKIVVAANKVYFLYKHCIVAYSNE